MPLREDDVAPRTGVPDRRILVQAAGFVLAIAATLAVFLTDDARLLKLAVVGVAWAFVIATFVAASRSAERVAAGAREAELRRSYEQELDREVAARREYELELEAELRREAEDSMRAELDALRGELAGLTELRAEVARVAELRPDVAALSALRDEVSRVAALRDDVAALTSLRQEIGQLSELRADMGRLRQELTEQLSSEMLIERIVMRTQASRLGPDPQEESRRALDAAARWADDAPPRELTGGWPAVRLDEPGGTRQVDQVRVERATRPPVPPPPAAPMSRPVPSPSWQPGREAEPERPRPWEAPATASWDALSTPSGETPATAWPATAQEDTAGHTRRGGAEPVSPTAAFPMTPPAGGSGADAVPPTTASPVVPPEPLPSPLEWLAARSLIDPEPSSFRPEVPPRRRRGDESLPDPAAAATTQRPAVPANPPIRVDDRGGYRVAVREEQQAERSGPPAAEKRLADILAENGVSPATGGRRRRRYRDEDEPDDVLARVLGSN